MWGVCSVPLTTWHHWAIHFILDPKTANYYGHDAFKNSVHSSFPHFLCARGIIKGLWSKPWSKYSFTGIFSFSFFFFFFSFVSKVIEGNSSCYFLKQTPLFKQAESMYSKIQNFIFYLRIAAPQQHLSHTYLVTVSLKNAVSDCTLNISMKWAFAALMQLKQSLS